MSDLALDAAVFYDKSGKSDAIISIYTFVNDMGCAISRIVNRWHS